MDQELQNHIQEAGAVVVESGTSWFKTHKRLILIVAIALVVVGVGLCIYFCHFHKQKTVTSIGERFPGQQLTAYQEYQVLANQGKYASAEQVLDQQLTKTTNASDKISIYYEQFSLALEFKYYNDAQKYADEAKKLSPNSPVAYSASAQLASAQGNTTTAKQYWEQAIKNLNPDQTGYNLIKQEYQASLDALP
jgi:tetratricopeptide (TPR) repeat protein